MTDTYKQFIVFAGPTYYPEGGWDDYRGSFEDEVDALRYLATTDDPHDWWHVVDLHAGRIVERKEGRSGT